MTRGPVSSAFEGSSNEDLTHISLDASFMYYLVDLIRCSTRLCNCRCNIENFSG